jgi:hypothetical protein
MTVNGAVLPSNRPWHRALRRVRPPSILADFYFCLLPLKCGALLAGVRTHMPTPHQID